MRCWYINRAGEAIDGNTLLVIIIIIIIIITKPYDSSTGFAVSIVKEPFVYLCWPDAACLTCSDLHRQGAIHTHQGPHRLTRLS